MGVFIVLDGMDGSGKSTQLSKLHTYLFSKDKRIRILSTREPTFGKHGQKIRAMLAHEKDPYASGLELLDLYIADRDEHLRNVIVPFLSRHDGNIPIVLCDRYYYSTIAYQATQGVALEQVLARNKMFLQPTLAFILTCSPEIALSRIHKERAEEKFEKLEFMTQLRKHFLSLPHQIPDSIVLVDSSGTQDETFEIIKTAVDTLLEETLWNLKH